MQLIDVADIAGLLKLNADHVRDRVTKRRDFPRAHRIGAGALRWSAVEVDAWIEARRLSPDARKPKRKKEIAHG
jgi:predicted DNA-binding transcriptional regulator AlpA